MWWEENKKCQARGAFTSTQKWIGHKEGRGSCNDKRTVDYIEELYLNKEKKKLKNPIISYLQHPTCNCIEKLKKYEA